MAVAPNCLTGGVHSQVHLRARGEPGSRKGRSGIWHHGPRGVAEEPRPRRQEPLECRQGGRGPHAGKPIVIMINIQMFPKCNCFLSVLNTGHS